MASAHQAHHLEYLRFIGRVWGKACFDGFLVESELVPAVYKFVLGADIGLDDWLQDLGDVDPAYARSLAWLLEHDMEAADLELTFVVEEEDLGLVRQVALKEGGEAIQVSAGNKHEYVELAARRRLIERVRPQVQQRAPVAVLCVAAAGVEEQNQCLCLWRVSSNTRRVTWRVGCVWHARPRESLRLSCTQTRRLRLASTRAGAALARASQAEISAVLPPPRLLRRPRHRVSPPFCPMQPC